jgi:lipoprotein
MVTEQLKKCNKIILLTASCVITISVFFSLFGCDISPNDSTEPNEQDIKLLGYSEIVFPEKYEIAYFRNNNLKRSDFCTTWFFYSNQEFHFPSYALVSREKSLGLSITKEDVDIIDFISKYLTRSQILKYKLSSENLKDYQLIHWHSKGFAFMSYSFKTDHGNLIYLQILEQYKKKK